MESEFSPSGTSTDPLFTPRLDLNELHQAVSGVRSEIARIIVGQEEMIDLIIAALLADGHVLIEGVPGVAKTLAARLAARTLAVDFVRIQFTPDLMPSDILGTSVFNAASATFEFKRGPIFSNVVLVDEINRAPAKTQSALFEVMEERQVSIDGVTHPMAQPFIVLATQNPIDQEGTYRLPEAQLDRFLFKIVVRYPTLEQETRILQAFNAQLVWNDLSTIRPVVDAGAMARARATVRAVRCDDPLIGYIARIIDATRNDGSLSLGASPRAGLAILAASKAMAAMAGRDFVTPDDVRRVTAPVLRHRVMLTPEREMDGQTADDVIAAIIARLEVPR